MQLSLDDLKEADILQAKQMQIENALEKFIRYFGHNYKKLKAQEIAASERTEYSEAPQFHYCFNELAQLFGFDEKKSITAYLQNQKALKLDRKRQTDHSADTHTSGDYLSPFRTSSKYDFSF